MANPVVDTHCHPWNRQVSAQLDKSLAWTERAGLPPKYTIENYFADRASHPDGDVIVINATEDPSEYEFLRESAHLGTERLQGRGKVYICPWVDLGSDPREFEGMLRSLVADPIVRSVRDIVQEKEPTFLTGENVLQNCAQLALSGKPLEALIYPKHLPALHDLLVKLQGMLPETPLPVVIQHLAKPFHDEHALDGGYDAWASWMRRIASDFLHVTCKLSFGFLEAEEAPTYEQWLEAVKVMCDAYGSDRLVGLGTNLPLLKYNPFPAVPNLAEQSWTFGTAVDLGVQSLRMGGLNENEVSRVLVDNPQLFYGSSRKSVGNFC